MASKNLKPENLVAPLVGGAVERTSVNNSNKEDIAVEDEKKDDEIGNYEGQLADRRDDEEADPSFDGESDLDQGETDNDSDEDEGINGNDNADSDKDADEEENAEGADTETF